MLRRWRWEGGGKGDGRRRRGDMLLPLDMRRTAIKCQHLAFIHLRRAADESVIMPGTWRSAYAAGTSVIITSNPRPSLSADPDPRSHPPRHPLSSTHFLTGRKLEPKPRAATSMARYPMAASLTAMVEVDMGWACREMMQRRGRRAGVLSCGAWKGRLGSGGREKEK